MSVTPLKTTTALVTSLSLLLPNPVFISPAWAQEADLLCLDESMPPCPDGEPEDGSTPQERADFTAAEAARLAAEAAEAARLMEEEAAEAEAEAARLQQEEAESAEAEAAQAEADRTAAEAAEAEAEAVALRAEADAAEADAQAAAEAAEAEAAAQAEMEAQTEAEAQAAAEAEARAAEEAEAQAAAEAEAEALAAEEAEALAAEEAAEAEALAAEAEAEAEEAEALAAEEAAEAEAEAEALATEAEAEAEALATQEAEAEAEAEVTAAEEEAEAEAEALAAEDAEAEEMAAEEEAEALAAEEAEVESEALAAEEAAEEAEAEMLAAEDEADEMTPEEAEAAAELALTDPTADEEEAAPVAATREAEAASEGLVEETLDEDSVRSSAEDFITALGQTAPSGTEGSGRSGLSNLETALLLGLGAVAVGAVLRSGDRVVANTGDRVVVEGPRGYTVYKDDDALLRQPGATVRTETFSDGSSRTFLDRPDGSRVETIRDSRGRVVRRAAIYPDGTQYELFDDLEPSQVVDVRQLQTQRPAARRLSVAESDQIALRAALREDMAFDAGRTFSLRQIREIEQVRSLVPAIDLDTVTFATGSAAIPPEQARSLVRLGILIEEMLFENPREIFLIEGHTDAVGSASYNLALSDRRAESVALALTESFRIPPENLIVQGYGESFLKVQTQAAEQRNRRATVRRITPLLRQIAAN